MAAQKIISRKTGRGFASMVKSADGKQRQKAIASAGGRTAHERGTAHKWTSSEARVAGQRGGIARQRT